MRRRFFVPIMAIGLAAVTTAASATVDLHRFWDNRCAECHGHSADFARRHLKVENGELTGPHHKSGMEQFIERHEAGSAQASSIYRMLLAQASTGPVYQTRCGGCHEPAAELARKTLASADGKLIVKSTGRPLEDLLQRHGKLTPDERKTVMDALTRVLAEVGGTK